MNGLKKTYHRIERWMAALYYGFLRILQGIRFPFYRNLNLYEVLRFYTIGLVRGFLTMRASAIAYNFFMAMFPFLLFMLSLIAFIPIDGFQEDFMHFIFGLIPPKSQDMFRQIVTDLALHRRESLLSLGLLLSIVFTANGVNAMLTGFESSVNKVYRVRRFYRQYGFALLISMLIFLIILTAIGMEIYSEIWIYRLQKQGLLGDIGPWIYWSKRLIYFLVILFLVSVIYHFGTEEGRQMPFFSPGSFLTSVFMIIGFYLFGLYIQNFNRYNQLYGSIGALLIIQFMFYVFAIILLMGHEFNMSIFKLHSRNGNGADPDV